ncbi:hypothetical protein BD311DRAFT_759155 [Dichomitus squalens]|uniref:F-box domain-containing protein n=1 Tax=Dichomitus squalens TaxID=114155 RepID=A0A4Q9MKH5_9APHY|nr:hypothetical protein BD311DRAFT_759155 [Dichomitus squalens]
MLQSSLELDPSFAMSTKTSDLPFSEFASILPAADLADLAGLCASAVRERTLARAEEYRRFALALHSVHNAVLPIHRLPFELLSTIFRKAWKDRSSLRMAHVCRRWRSTALQTPALWADAIACTSFTLAGPDHVVPLRYSYMDTLLERSVPRDVRMTICYFPKALRFHLLPHISRIAVLDIKIHSANQLHNLWETLRGGMSCLEGLYILCPITDYHEFIDYPPRTWLNEWGSRVACKALPNGSLPRLRHLRIPGALFPLIACGTLTHVTLHNPRPHKTDIRLPSATRLHKALGKCRETLEVLRLIQVLPTPQPTRDTAIGEHREPIHLRSLCDLLIVEERAFASGPLVGLILPPTCRIHLSDGPCTDHPCPWGHDPGPDHRVWLDPDQRSLEAVHSLLSGISLVKLEIGWKFTMRCYTQDGSAHSPSERFRAETFVRHSRVETIVRPLFRPEIPMLSVNVTHLVLSIIDGWYSEQPALFEAFPHLLRVEIDVKEAGLWETLYLLKGPGEGNSDGTGSRGPVCPSLRELVMWVEVPKGSLRPLLESPNLGDFEEYVAKRMRQFRDVLEWRAFKSPSPSRLTYLKIHQHEEGSLKTRGRTVVEDDLSSIESKVVQACFEDLYALVDGEVVFKGFR